MFCSVLSGGIRGIESFPVNVECDISNGMPGFDIVGYVGGEVREARDRIRTSLRNAGFSLPIARITVNLSPGDVKKSGTGFDLPMALSVLSCMQVIDDSSLDGVFVAGELSLSGEVCPTKGILPMILMAKKHGVRRCIIPIANSKEGSVVEDIKIYGVSSLKEAVGFLGGSYAIDPIKSHLRRDLEAAGTSGNTYEYDFSRIKGQKMA